MHRSDFMYLCKRCIAAIESRGETIYVGNLIEIEEVEEQKISCEWCGESTEVYKCNI